MAEIDVHGRVFLVDDEWYPVLAKMTWSLQEHPSCVYATTKIRGNTVGMHRIVAMAPVGGMVDHANGDTLDNRSENLRIATNQENQRNRKKVPGTKDRKYTSKYKGVWFAKHQKRKPWCSRIRVDRSKRRYVGYFATEEEAARAYDAVAKEFFGRFARLNFEYGAAEFSAV